MIGYSQVLVTKGIKLTGTSVAYTPGINSGDTILAFNPINNKLEFKKYYNPPVGSDLLKTVTVDIDEDSINTLGRKPYRLINAVLGADPYYIKVVSLDLIIVPDGGLTFNSDLNVQWGGSKIGYFTESQIETTTSDIYSMTLPSPTGYKIDKNKNLTIRTSSGIDPTGSHGTMRFIIYYIFVEQ